MLARHLRLNGVQLARLGKPAHENPRHRLNEKDDCGAQYHDQKPGTIAG